MTTDNLKFAIQNFPDLFDLPSSCGSNINATWKGLKGNAFQYLPAAKNWRKEKKKVDEVLGHAIIIQLLLKLADVKQRSTTHLRDKVTRFEMLQQYETVYQFMGLIINVWTCLALDWR